MDSRNIEYAFEIVTKLLNGEEISRANKENISLYEEYNGNGDVYDLVQIFLKKMNLKIYEYNYGLYVTAGENNRVFGFSNEELKKALGVRLHKELYLCYYIMYQVVTHFYHTSATPNYVEYISMEDVISSVDSSLNAIFKELDILVQGEMEENSFRTLAVLWSDLPLTTGGELEGIRAAKNSKTGFVKLVFNFLVSQKLLLEADNRYYPKERLKALMENYFEEYQGRLYEIMSGRTEEAFQGNVLSGKENPDAPY